MAEPSAQTKKLKNKARASLMLLLVAIVSITTATYAWFSLSNTTVVQDMTVQVGTGAALKAYAGTTTSTNLANYFGVIKSQGSTGATGEVITQGLAGGITSFDAIRLWPLTSGNGTELYTQTGNLATPPVSTAPEAKYYAQVTLTFLSDTDMEVYLNGENSPGATGPTADGTLVTAARPAGSGGEAFVDECVRISFADEKTGKTVIYEPNRPATGVTLEGKAATDAGGNTQNTFGNLGNNLGRNKGKAEESPVLFPLTANVPKTIVLRIWIEGADDQCKNGNDAAHSNVNIEKEKVTVRLRFCGADGVTGNYVEVAPT